MDEGFSPEAVIDFFKRNLFLSGILFLGLALLGGGFFITGVRSPEVSSVVFETESITKTGATASASPDSIMVDIGGAVSKPGVYELESDARVQEVLKKAGGLSDKADHQFIAQSINLAAKVTDGQKLYFPHKGESGAAVAPQKAVLGNTQSSSGLVNLNTASQTELESLPGIGEVTATKIMKARPYSTVEDLTAKKVVGESVYGKIRDLVTVN